MAVSSRKHLVLEDDVYQDLVSRKELSGLPLGMLGNAILRTHIRSTAFEDMVCRKLIATGKLTEAEYQRILDEAARDLRQEASSGAPPIAYGPDGEMLSGSLAIQNIYTSPGGVFQLLEVWARDALQRPMGQHLHQADEYVVGLEGRTLFVLNGTPCTLQQGSVFLIPAGSTHSAKPLGPDSHLLALLVPAVIEYSATPNTH
jgi:mannose-6-phosphate isomerase-like protein (cupin superfamily)